jgi:hypothetical protein
VADDPGTIMAALLHDHLIPKALFKNSPQHHNHQHFSHISQQQLLQLSAAIKNHQPLNSPYINIPRHPKEHKDPSSRHPILPTKPNKRGG